MSYATTVFWTALHIFTLLSDAAPVSAREKVSLSSSFNDSLSLLANNVSGNAVAVANDQQHLSGDATKYTVDKPRDSLSKALIKRKFWSELERKITQLNIVTNSSDAAATTACLLATIVPGKLQEKHQERVNQKAVYPLKMNDQPVIHDIELEEKDENDMEHHGYKSHPFYGVVLAIIAACLVGSSFIFQKKALIKTDLRKSKTTFIRSGTLGEFAYLTQWMWWCGMISMAFGEILNFVAYSVAPAILITPLGALRVIVSAVLASIFLNERLNVHGKIGVLLSLVGSVMIIIHAPRHEKVHTFEQVVVHFTDTTFLFYCTILVALTIFLIVHVAPRHGRTNIMVYISVCNIVGALCVLCGKGIGISIREIGQKGEFIYLHPIFLVLVIGNVVGIVTQIVYFNKALAIFDTCKITPIKYVFTNVFLIFGSILLFQEFAFMSIEDIIGISCGFVTVVTGVALLNLFKNLNTSEVTITKK